MKLGCAYSLFVLAVSACIDPSEAGNLVPKTVDEDPSLPAIEINGARLHAETYGASGAPVVMVLHGGPGGDYRGLLPLAALADDGRIDLDPPISPAEEEGTRRRRENTQPNTTPKAGGEPGTA